MLGKTAVVTPIFNAAWIAISVTIPKPRSLPKESGAELAIKTPKIRTATKAKKVTKATKVAREIVFFLNGTEVGAVAASSLGSEELQLAVQPYMGGVALLTNFEV